jgi:HK97 family phage portal protein
VRLIDRLRPVRETNRAPTGLVFDAGGDPERLLHNFQSYIDEGYKTSGPIFALISIRSWAYSEARFLWRDRATSRLFGSAALQPVETPWPNGTTGLMLAATEVDKSLSGNAYWWRRPDDDVLQRLRPDWVDIIKARREGSPAVDLLGYRYYPGGRQVNRPVDLPVSEVAHIIDHPDPDADFRGQSWLTPVAREADADALMTKHKARFFANAATPNLAIKTETRLDPQQRELLRDQFETRHQGFQNAYKTVLLEDGADLEVIGNTFEQMSFSAVQAAGETRLAAAAGVPPVVVGFLQGIQAATYSNYSQAMRRFADLTVRPMWRQAAAAFASILDIPTGAELWYDDRRIPFLQQDAKDASTIRKEDSLTIESLIRSGFEPASVVTAVMANDFKNLDHSGLISVQLKDLELEKMKAVLAAGS